MKISQGFKTHQINFVGQVFYYKSFSINQLKSAYYGKPHSNDIGCMRRTLLMLKIETWDEFEKNLKEVFKLYNKNKSIINKT